MGGKRFFNFRTRGALHKARGMAKLLYGLKICLLQSATEELPPVHQVQLQQWCSLQN